MSEEHAPITELLRQYREGKDQEAFRTVIEAIYKKLRGISHNVLQKWSIRHFQTTALVHQAYEDLKEKGQLKITDREHFLKLAALGMQRLLIHEARKAGAIKRGPGVFKEVLEDLEIIDTSAHSPEELLVVESLLDDLYQQDELMGWVVELRVFGEFHIWEIAEITGVSQATVKRKWTFARNWLYQQYVEAV